MDAGPKEVRLIGVEAAHVLCSAADCATFSFSFMDSGCQESQKEREGREKREERREKRERGREKRREWRERERGARERWTGRKKGEESKRERVRE